MNDLINMAKEQCAKPPVELPDWQTRRPGPTARAKQHGKCLADFLRERNQQPVMDAESLKQLAKEPTAQTTRRVVREMEGKP